MQRLISPARGRAVPPFLRTVALVLLFSGLVLASPLGEPLLSLAGLVSKYSVLMARLLIVQGGEGLLIFVLLVIAGLISLPFVGSATKSRTPATGPPAAPSRARRLAPPIWASTHRVSPTQASPEPTPSPATPRPVLFFDSTLKLGGRRVEERVIRLNDVSGVATSLPNNTTRRLVRRIVALGAAPWICSEEAVTFEPGCELVEELYFAPGTYEIGRHELTYRDLNGLVLAAGEFMLADD